MIPGETGGDLLPSKHMKYPSPSNLLRITLMRIQGCVIQLNFKACPTQTMRAGKLRHCRWLEARGPTGILQARARAMSTVAAGAAVRSSSSVPRSSRNSQAGWVQCFAQTKEGNVMLRMPSDTPPGKGAKQEHSNQQSESKAETCQRSVCLCVCACAKPLPKSACLSREMLPEVPWELVILSNSAACVENLSFGRTEGLTWDSHKALAA